MVRSPLLRPLVYLSIQHDSKRLDALNWWMPMSVGGVLTCLGIAYFPGVNLFREGGLFAMLLGFVQSLPGFYLAALAAVATFAKPDLDQPMPGTPPRAKILYNGQLETVNLTRRRFLCMMFSYLTALSILITVLLISVIAVRATAFVLLPPEAIPFLRIGAAFVVLSLFSQMIIITLWGLFYLGERVLTPDT